MCWPRLLSYVHFYFPVCKPRSHDQIKIIFRFIDAQTHYFNTVNKLVFHSTCVCTYEYIKVLLTINSKQSGPIELMFTKNIYIGFGTNWVEISKTISTINTTHTHLCVPKRISHIILITDLYGKHYN